MNKTIIALLVLILLVSILCLKISLFEYFNTNIIDKSINKINKLCNTTFTESDMMNPASMTSLMTCMQNLSPSELETLSDII
jgi:hypothetical protein